VLVVKDPSLLGKTFEVDIVATGKHFMKGVVVKDSQVRPVPRPLPLPPGNVSGMEVWQSRTSGAREEGKGSVDISLILFGLAILIILIVRLIL
jgi:hypothetical protein